MSYQEKRALASVVSTALASIFYFRDVFSRLPEGGLSAATDLRFWATAFLIYIPIFVVFNIVVQIVFIIFNAIATRKEEPDITDEFDRLVGLKADRIFGYVFTGGVVLSMLALAAGQPAWVLFVGIMFTAMTAGISQDIAQFVFYRRGF